MQVVNRSIMGDNRVIKRKAKCNVLAIAFILLMVGGCSRQCPTDMRGTYKLDNKETYLVIDRKDSLLFCKPRNKCVRAKYTIWESMFNFEDLTFLEYNKSDPEYGDLSYFKGGEMHAPCIGMFPFGTGIDVGVEMTAVIRPLD
jgi:hypothetical protein